MIPIKKRKSPKSLEVHKKTSNSDYANYSDKDTLRSVLYSEQHGICCYCMGRIEINNTKIAHWHSQARYPKESLNYQNLHLACLGGKGNPEDKQHCDTYQGNRDLLYNPSDPNHVNRFNELRYKGDGTIESPNPAFNEQLNDRSNGKKGVLNLNLPYLKNNRKEVLNALLESINSKFKNKPLTKKFIRHNLKKWEKPNSENLLSSYCGVAIYWLNKHLYCKCF